MVARTSQDKMRDIVAIKDAPGADPTGVTSSAGALVIILAALAAAGGDIFVTPGDWLIDESVHMEQNAILIRGTSPLATRIINGTTNDCCFYVGDDINTFTRNGFCNLAFAQQTGVAPVSGNCAIYASKQSNLVLDNIQIFPYPAALHQGLVFNGVSQSYFSQLGVQGCLDIGVFFKGSSLDLYVSDSRSDSNGVTGWVIEDCAGFYGDSISAYNNTSYAFDLRTAGGTGNNYIFIDKGVGDTSGNHNWEITNCIIGGFTNCWAGSQQSTAVNTSACGLHVNGPSCSDMTFDGFKAVGNNAHGMYIQRALRTTISSPTAGTAALTGTVNGRSGAGSGIKIGTQVNILEVSGGSSSGNPDYGVDVDAGALSVNVHDINLRDNLTQPVRNNANGTTAEATFRNCGGYNPQLNLVTTPAVPASTVVITNLTGLDVMAYISGGTLTEIKVAASFVLGASPASIFLPAGATISMTYSVAPIWKWIAA